MPNTVELSFNWGFWLTLGTWVAAGLLAILATVLAASLARKRVHMPPEAVLVVGGVTVASYIDIEIGAWLAGTLGLCALAVGLLEYVRGRNLEQGRRKHLTPEHWIAHFRGDQTCPCADKPTPEQPGDRGDTPAAAGPPTSPPGHVASTRRSGFAPRVDAGRPEDTRPVVGGERPATPVSSAAAPAAVRHHVSGLTESSRSAGDVVPPPRRTPEPVVHVTGSVEALVETG